MLQGSFVRDSEGQAALFGEIASTPTSLNTMRAGITYAGLVEGGETQQSDAVSAYTQHILTPADGDPVWIRLPADWMLPCHAKFADPVFLLLRPLYGHPAAGRIWEKHLSDIMSSFGWFPIENFPNTWITRSPETQKEKEKKEAPPWVVASVYVDDFVLNGRGLKPLWDEIRKHLTLSDPEPIGKLLGCKFSVSRGGPVTTITQNMSEFISQAVYNLEHVIEAGNLKLADTP